MSDVELVITIPEGAYNLLKTSGVDWLGAEHILDAVSKGTPLPEHHGRIMDVDKVIEKMEERKEQLEDDMSIWGTATALDMFGETIIEAESEKV